MTILSLSLDQVKVGGLILFSPLLFKLESCWAQTEVLIDREFIGISVQEAVSIIEDAYPVRFFFKPNEIPDTPLNVTFHGKPLIDAVDEMLKGSDLKAFHLTDYAVIIGKKSLLDQTFTNEFYQSFYELDVSFEESVDDKVLIIGKNELNPQGRATISGQVRDVDTGQQLSGCIVSIPGNGMHMVTDEKGNFSVKLPIGNYHLKFEMVGYSTLYQKVKLRNDGGMILELPKESLLLDEVIISSSTTASTLNTVMPGFNSITASQVKKAPSFLGESDVLRYLLYLPGVSSVGEGASGINVRGGNTDENLFTMHESVLFNSSHALGFFGAINSDVVDRIQLYKGAIPVYFGGRISSVVDIKLKEASNDKFIMKGGIGPVTSNLSLQVPLIKDKASLMIAGRSSYSDWLLKRVNVPDVRSSSIFFYDFNLNYTHHLNDRSKIRGSWYSSQDDFRFSNDFGFEHRTTSSSLSLSNEIGKNWLSELSLAYTNYQSSRQELGGNTASEFKMALQQIKLKEHLRYEPNEKASLNLGGSIIYYNSSPGEISPTHDVSIVSFNKLELQKGLEAAGFLGLDFILNPRISVSGGVRGSFYYRLGPGKQFFYEDPTRPRTHEITDTLFFAHNSKMASYSTIEPRIAIAYNAGNKQFKAAYSRTAQYIFQLSNTSTPTPIDVWLLSNKFLTPQRAHNFSLGLNVDTPYGKWSTSIEGFYKIMSGLNDYKDLADLIVNEHIETELIPTEGRSYGIEFGLYKKAGKMTGNMAYTLSRSERRSLDNLPELSVNQGEWYPANFDRTHDFMITTHYRFNSRHSIAAIFNFITGRPTTAPIGFFDINASTRVPVYSERNQLRIPNYHRLDFTYSLEQGHRKDKRWKSSWTFGVYNVYGRRNAYSVFYTQAPLSGVKANKFSVLGSAFPAVTYHFNFE